MKNTIRTILKVILVIVIVIVMSVAGIVGATLYKRWEADLRENSETPGGIVGIVNEEKVKEECFTCLFMGVNGPLTDFIMLGQYNPNTREISLLSIPRDTNVSNSVDGKINSIYSGREKNATKVIETVEKITGIKADHYLVFSTKILRNIVDEIGGVTVDVPINMNYDDPEQNLYIHLKKGTQKLSGKQAEQFVRFRQNNDGTGYKNGDIGRIAAQQDFIKAMASEVLSAKNISKIGNLVKIVLDGTKTDIKMDTISKYMDDAVTIKTDRIRIETIPGEGRYGMSPYGYKLSYYYHDESRTKALVEELFKSENEITGEDDAIETNGTLIQEAKIRLEILNTSSNVTILNNVVETLNEGDFDVVKIGNYKTTQTESSRIIDYGIGTEEELNKLKEALKINKVEKQEDESSSIKYTVIIGQNYK